MENWVFCHFSNEIMIYETSFYSEVCPKHYTVVNLVTNPIKDNNYRMHKLLCYSKSVFCLQSVCVFICSFLPKLVFSFCQGKKSLWSWKTKPVSRSAMMSKIWNITEIVSNLKCLKYLCILIYIVSRRFVIELRTSDAHLFPSAPYILCITHDTLYTLSNNH